MALERGWERSSPFVEIGLSTIERIVDLAFPGAALAVAERLPGGLANSNYRIETSGQDGPLVLRLYSREPEAWGREAAVLAAVAGVVPAPRILFRDDNREIVPYPFVIESWLDGTPLQEVLDHRPDLLEAVGRSLGATAAVIGRVQFEKPGFLAAGEPLEVAGELPDLTGYIESCLSSPEALERLGAATAQELTGFVRANERYVAFDGPARLVHGDYKPSNLLIDTASGSVTGVLDWEFAFAGPPLYDLATLLRGSDALPAAYEAAVCDGFVAAGGLLPHDWKRRVRLLDFANLASFIALPGESRERSRAVRGLFEETLRRWLEYPA